MGGATNQWAPTLYEGVRPVVRATPRGHLHLTTELADRAIAWTREGAFLTPPRRVSNWARRWKRRRATTPRSRYSTPP